MKRHHLFYSPVIETELDLDYTDLTNKILKESETESSRVYSNRGGWQSEDKFMFRDSLRPYLDEIDRHVNQTCAEFYDFNFRFHNCWVNINERGNYNVAHKHTACELTGVLWIQAPKDSGDIVFFHPSDHSVIPEIYDDLSLTWNFTPSQGSVLLFPSYLTHFVEESCSDDRRISISFNYG